ncbi:hypothetical protein PR202_gb22754 [Eleusine coracana subsp. coracana]|uniref:Glycosyltransferase n=2 Tax=Eleusine coracana subsp. coracana TaxID=191504 RepID=A0AAV5FGY4_ELECO|nr:hypothetical protein QOZ80_6AG0533990 [Eleusine coracana subsp. coracana]GJN34113.1 hypothetical protein PR202_gb22754 [Eleusine coracana subsp. coracana]
MMASAATSSSPRKADNDVQHQQARQLPHVVIFPFMAKSHAIPLIHLAHLLRRRRLATVTFFTTPGNAAFLRAALSGADDGVAVVELPFIKDQQPAAESVEALPSFSSFPTFVDAMSALRPRFEEALAALRPPASVVVADAFLRWAHAAAAALGVRTLAFVCANMFAQVIREVCVRDNPAAVLAGGAKADAVFTVPEFPHVQLTLADIPVPYNDPTPTGPIREMDAEVVGKAVAGSHGLIVNTFDALESRYIEHWNRQVGPRAWPIGPFCLARPPPDVLSRQGDAAPAYWLRWLDEKAAAGRAVLYVALGTFMAVPEAQLREVADGLEKSGLDFMWAVRPVDVVLAAGFEERVRDRGLVVREWVDQFAVLQHECVKGFLSHCGWNSILESICAGVPLAAWPMGAEQPLNAKMAVEELRVGLKVSAGSSIVTSGLVSSQEIATAVRELVIGEKGAEMARNAAAMAAKAQEAVAEGGSSWKALKELIGGFSEPVGDATMEV